VVRSSSLVLLSSPHLWLLCMTRRNACGMRFGSLFFFFSGKCLVRSFILLAEFSFGVCLSCVSLSTGPRVSFVACKLSIYIPESSCSEGIASLLEIHIPVPPLRGERFKLLEVEAPETTISQCWLS